MYGEFPGLAEIDVKPRTMTIADRPLSEQVFDNPVVLWQQPARRHQLKPQRSGTNSITGQTRERSLQDMTGLLSGSGNRNEWGGKTLFSREPITL